MPYQPVLAPQVDPAGRWFRKGPDTYLRAHLQRKLIACTGRGDDYRAAPHEVDRAMHMAADDGLDLWIVSNCTWASVEVLDQSLSTALARISGVMNVFSRSRFSSISKYLRQSSISLLSMHADPPRFNHAASTFP